MDRTKAVAVLLAVGTVFAALSFVGAPTIAGTASANQSNLEVNSVSISEDTLQEGDSTEITAEVENTGVFSDTFSVQLEVDGSTVQSTNVFISGYSTTEVTFEETFSSPGEYSISVNGVSGGTVTVGEPASFDVTDASLGTDEIAPGESVETTATIENTGDLEGSFDAELEVDGQTVDSEPVTVDGGESTTVSFDRSFSDIGSYDVSVSGETAGTVTVGEPASFDVTDASLDTDEITPGESVETTATIENTGDLEGSFDAELEVDGQTVDSEPVTVDGGESTTVSFDRSFSDAGSYDVSVSGETAGTVTVLEPASFEVTDASLASAEIVRGDAAEATATVENTGDLEGSFDAELEVDGQTVDSQSVTVAGGESEAVSFDRSFSEAGNFDVSIGGVDAGTLDVLTPPDIEATTLEATPNPALEGETVDIVATLDNDGEATGEFEAELQVGGSTEETQTATVDGESSEQVSFERSFAEAGEYSVQVSGSETATVTVEEPASFTVTDLSLASDEVVAGDSVGITATVENTGDREGTFDAVLQIDGETATSNSVTVGGGESTDVSFDPSFDEAGEYRIQVPDSETATVTVDQPATFEVSESSISNSVILEGDTVTISGTVTNVGDRSGGHSTELTVDGQDTGTQRVELGPDESTTVSFQERFDTSGNYDISIDDSSAGELRVDQPATFEIDDATVNRSQTIALNPIAVNLTVSNVGDREGNYTAGLTANGETVAGHELTISGSSSESRTYTTTFDEPGEYDLAVNGTRAGTVAVAERPEFEIRNVSIPADLVAPGEQTTAEFVVENPSNWTVTRSINVTAGSEPVGAKTVTLDSGERREMAVKFEAAEGEITIQGIEAGSIELIRQPQDGTTETDDDSESTSMVPIILTLSMLVIFGGIGGGVLPQKAGRN
ncbi:CARDB domain-containing protein [Natrialbaceae archaeon GCM10025896]